MYSVKIHLRCERCGIFADLYMIYNYLLRIALLDRIRGWFYYVFIRGKDIRSEGNNLSRLSVIGDIPIRSSPKHSCLLTVTTFLPEKALKSRKLLLQNPNIDHRNWAKINASLRCSKFAVVHHVVYSLWVG